MDQNLQSRVDHCYTLAENGYVVVANALLPHLVEQFLESMESLSDVESFSKSIERTSHRMGIENAFEYAEFFYQKGDKGAARGWLRYAKWHAGKLKLNIGYRVSGMKRRYKDRIPLLF